MNCVIVFILLIVFVVMVVYFWMGLCQDLSEIFFQFIDEVVFVFDFLVIEGFDQGLSYEDIQGEVVLLNFFGFWCLFCLIEYLMLMQIVWLGMVLIYVIDWKDEFGVGVVWFECYGNFFIYIGDDQFGWMVIDFGVIGVLEIFLIDCNGWVCYCYVGVIIEEVWEDILCFMVEVL